MNEEAVRARARQAGLAVDWVDAMGRPQQVRTESLRRILESLDGTQDQPDVPPLVTARVDARIALPDLSIEADTPAELTLEDGSVRPVTIRGGKAATRARRSASRATTACASPTARSRSPWRRRAASPSRRSAPAAGCGASPAQIYGLRRAGDGGIGDAGAVRDLAEAAARHGADAVALSPVHSLFAADPARYGPIRRRAGCSSIRSTPILPSSSAPTGSPPCTARPRRPWNRRR